MARILGLDLGSYSVKAVLFESAMRGAQAKAYGEVRRHEAERTETLKTALRELFAKNAFSADQVVVSLPGPSLATHQLTLPFTDTKRIDATLAFEVESQLPFDLSEAVFDYQLAGAAKDKRSDLLIGVVRKEEIAALLATLAELNIDPKIITHPALVYQSLFNATPSVMHPVGETEAVALLEIGHERSCLALGRPGVGIEFARTFPGGGRDLTRALATEFATAPADANQWKEAHGALGSAVHGPDAERAAAAFVRGLQPVLRELRPSLKAASARTRQTITRLYLCGGTSRMPGIDQHLARDLSMPVERLQLPNDALAVIPRESQSAAVQAYTLALRGSAAGPKASRFNLRRGDLSFKGDYDYVKEKTGMLVAFGATLLVLLIAGGVVRNSVLSQREKRIDDVVCDITQRVLGQCEKNYDRALNLLRGKESPSAVIPKLSAVSLLAELTDRMPKEANVTLDQIVVDFDRVTLRGETDSSKQVDLITTALKAYRCFHEVKPGKVEKSKTGAKVTFNLDIQIECPEQGTASAG